MGSQGNCPHGWLDGSFVGLGCLLFNATEGMTWIESSIYCRSAYTNGSLVEILTVEQMDFLQMDLEFLEAQDGKKHWWTGATDLGVEGVWTWQKSREIVEDFVWFTNEPCTSPHYPICQIQL